MEQIRLNAREPVHDKNREIRAWNKVAFDESGALILVHLINPMRG